MRTKIAHLTAVATLSCGLFLGAAAVAAPATAAGGNATNPSGVICCAQ
jgi:hypothetical protein